jgi:hypothetical protein
MISGLIFWFAFFWFGHWAIVRPPLNWLVFVYTILMIVAYLLFLRREYKVHAKIPMFQKMWFAAGIVYACPLLTLLWTIWEIVERL